MNTKARLVIIGGGIVGSAVARQAALNGTFGSIVILEKESTLGFHSSSRNSGVIHAGFYYDPDSVRGKFCANGSELMRQYCLDNKLPLNKCGKVVVSKNKDEDHVLKTLKDRGDKNGCNISLLPKSELSLYERFANTSDTFLWSPNTWSASPQSVILSLENELKELDVVVKYKSKVVAAESHKVYLADGSEEYFDVVVNVAGGHALSVANIFGLVSDFRLLPFKGLYLRSSKPDTNFSAHIYPVPDINQPFLGIHTTLTSDGFLKLGPTALPALSVENYRLFEGIEWHSLFPLLSLQLSLLISNDFNFRDLALKEVQYLLKHRLLEDAQKLTSLPLLSSDFAWYSPGIRAQLFDVKLRKLVTDFLLERIGNSYHVLNSISPSWTCSFYTAKHVMDMVESSL